MYSFNRDFIKQRFLSDMFIVPDFLNDNDINDIKECVKQNNVNIQNGFVNFDEKNNSSKSWSLVKYDDSESKSDVVDPYRNNSMCWIFAEEEPIINLYKKISASIFELNEKYFGYDLTDIETLQWSSYSTNEYYKKHIDISPNLEIGKTMRKLSFSVQLSDENSYEGGDLSFHTNDLNQFVAPKKKGTAIIFSSFTLHQVTPVTKGVRESLVGWVIGPRFR